MFTAKASLFLVALVAGVALVQAAGGIKGQRPESAGQPGKGVKRPQLEQTYLPPPPPLAPAPVQLAPVRQTTKGAGQVTPIFSAMRVQQPEPQQVQIQQQPIQQQQIQQVQQQEQEPESQQQQQESEIDPNAAAQDAAPALAAPAVPAPAANEEEANPRPEPYAFKYAFDAADSVSSGSSEREETQDTNGRVTGFYTLRGEDGRDRRVDYVADADGFRATISTNEMGTAAKNPADVDLRAAEPTDAQQRTAESATQLARQRALQNPQASASGSSQLFAGAQPSKVNSPRQNAPAAGKGQPITAQLQEPFEQIRQTELNSRARKSRQAPFYLFTV